ncbi:MAG: PD-(D/E)XK nuclease family protein [Firmicutes bacterium]|nr:PD-(D/E)XK nuclease family protein [Bacillota bacterium]
MALRFVLGPAGSGKTTLCLEEIAACLRQQPLGSPLILLVPEQATFQMEQSILRRLERPGFARLQVLSFRRLALRIFQAVGSAKRPRLDELGKKMLLQAILWEHAAELRYFPVERGHVGFLDSLAATLREFHLYEQGPQELAALQARLEEEKGPDHPLSRKVADLALIYGLLEQRLKGRFSDPDEYLTQAAQALPRWPALAGAQVWVDGFAGFTPQQYHVLRELALHARRVSVALTLEVRPEGRDPGEYAAGGPGQTPAGAVQAPGPVPASGPPPVSGPAPALDDPFATILEPYLRLLSLAEEYDIAVEPPVVLKAAPAPRFARSPVLAHLAGEFPRHPAAAWPGPVWQAAPVRAAEATSLAGDPPVGEMGLKLVEAAHRRAEVQAVAHEILRLCREQGYRFREIGVIVRSFDPYEALFRTIFTPLGIPFFLDQPRSISHHPLVELLRSALETLQAGWPAGPVFRYLRTDLIPGVSRDEVDLLENYVLAHGIRGSTWYQEADWRFRTFFSLDAGGNLDEDASAPARAEEEEFLQTINGIRRRAIAGLCWLQEQLGGPGALSRALPVRVLNRALADLLEQLDVAGTLRSWSASDLAQGRPENAREHPQVWEAVLNLLDQLDMGLGSAQVPLAEYASILEAGLQSAQVGLIPPSLDQVTISCVDRSRQPEVRAAFVLGLNDREFPSVPPEDPMFPDAERQELRQFQFELGPGSEGRLAREHYYVYVALTRAREQLVLSYPLADAEGRALAPSPVVARLRRMFPALVPQNAGYGPGTGRETLMQQLAGADSVAQLAACVAQARTEALLSGAPWDAGAPRDAGAWGDIDGSSAAAVPAAAGGTGDAGPGPRSLPASSTAQVLDRLVAWLLHEPERRRQAEPVLAASAYRIPQGRLPQDLARSLFPGPFITSVSRLETFAACPFRHFAAMGLGLQPRPLFQLQAPEKGSFYHAVLAQIVRQLAASGRPWRDWPWEELRDLLHATVARVARQLEKQLLLATARDRHRLAVMEQVLAQSLRSLWTWGKESEFRPAYTELTFGRGGQLPPLPLALPGGGQAFLVGRVDRVDMLPGPAQPYVFLIDYKSGSVQPDYTAFFWGLQLQLPLYVAAVVRALQAQPGGWAYFRIQEPWIRADGFAPGPDLDPEDLDRRRRKDMCFQGVFHSQPGLLHSLAHDCGQPGSLVPVRLKKDGQVHRSDCGRVLDEDQWQALLSFAQARAAQLAQEVLSGEISARPFYQTTSHANACRYCPYGAVCRFEPRVAGASYRFIRPLSRDGVLAAAAAWIQAAAAPQATGGDAV